MGLIDLHQHTEWPARLNQRLAPQPVDWRQRRREVAEVPVEGLSRLQYLFSVPGVDPDAVTAEVFVFVVQDALETAAKGGASFTQLRLPQECIAFEGFMDLFHSALKQTQTRFPHFDASAILSINLWDPTAEEVGEMFTDAFAAGLSGIELLYVPYVSQSDWTLGSALAASAHAAGLDVTIPAGAFSASNVEAVATMSGVRRMAHAIGAASDPGLLRLIASSKITVEVCLSAALTLGMVSSLDKHPLPLFLEHGIPVVLGTDSPLRLGTTIADEYQLARSVGLSATDIEAVQRNASSFVSGTLV